ncbi:MAG: dipeptidase [Chloroflexota bacterium]
MTSIILDAHQDIAFNMACFRRNYRISALKQRQLEAGTATPQRNGIATIGLPEAIAGRVAVVFSTIFTAPQSASAGPWDCVTYADVRQAYSAGMQQMDIYHRLEDHDPRLRLVHSRADLDAVLATWADDRRVTERVQGLVILMENADPILEPRQFEAWYERGVRVVGPAWQATRYSAGTGAPGRLTPLGHELLDVLGDFGVLLDLSHMAEEAFMEALDRYPGPVIASHSNPRHFCNTDRHLSDDMIRRLAERDGVMGIVMANGFLQGGWKRADGKHVITLERVLDAIDYVCQITGSAAHVGLGSDFDGGFGAESVPSEIDTVADLWQIKAGLEGRGFSIGDVDAILSGNMLRKLTDSLPETS